MGGSDPGPSWARGRAGAAAFGADFVVFGIDCFADCSADFLTYFGIDCFAHCFADCATDLVYGGQRSFGYVGPEVCLMRVAPTRGARIGVRPYR